MLFNVHPFITASGTVSLWLTGAIQVVLAVTTVSLTRHALRIRRLSQ